MKSCDECPLADKIYECCGRFPDSGESVGFMLEGNVRVAACPHLDGGGRCRIYYQRPLKCQMHYCDGVNGGRFGY